MQIRIGGASAVGVVAVDDGLSPRRYAPPVMTTFEAADPDAYARLADCLNAEGLDAVILQHEFGLFGGSVGHYITKLTANLRVPLTTVFHSILGEPSREQRRITRTLAEHSTSVVALSATGHEFLSSRYSIDPSRCFLLPHGVPMFDLRQRSRVRRAVDWADRVVAVTFGLLGPGKGIEYALRALPAIVAREPRFLYVILGTTHPHIVRHSGETYRRTLQRQVGELALEGHVLFIDEFPETPRLCELLLAADLFVAPYLAKEQICSGTIAYAIAAGLPVIATPTRYAREMISEARGRIVPFRDSAAVADAALELLERPDASARHRGYTAPEVSEMHWPNVAKLWVDLCLETTSTEPVRSRRALSARLPSVELP